MDRLGRILTPLLGGSVFAGAEIRMIIAHRGADPVDWMILVLVPAIWAFAVWLYGRLQYRIGERRGYERAVDDVNTTMARAVAMKRHLDPEQWERWTKRKDR